MIAETLRALLQQPSRDRYRRQDAFDIAYVLTARPICEPARARIVEALRIKCGAPGLKPDRDSVNDREVIRRAKRDWASLRLETVDLPSFQSQFEIVSALYRSPPWND